MLKRDSGKRVEKPLVTRHEYGRKRGWWYSTTGSTLLCSTLFFYDAAVGVEEPCQSATTKTSLNKEKRQDCYPKTHFCLLT